VKAVRLLVRWQAQTVKAAVVAQKTTPEMVVLVLTALSM